MNQLYDPRPEPWDEHSECRDHIEHLEAAAERMRKMLIAAETELVRLREEVVALQHRRLGVTW